MIPQQLPTFLLRDKHNQIWGAVSGDAQLTAKLEVRRPGWGGASEGANARKNWHETPGKGAGRLAAQGEVQSPVPSLTESVGYPDLIRVDLGSGEGVSEGWDSLEDGRHWWNLI